MSRLPAFDLSSLPHFAQASARRQTGDCTGLKIYIGPPQATQFAQTHSGEDSRDDKWPQSAGGVVDQRVDLGDGWEVNARAQRPLGDLPLVPFYFDALATFCATSPRPCAKVSMEPTLVITLCRIACERPASRNSLSNA